jgi:nucleotide-binding universal stress UspA family protein
MPPSNDFGRRCAGEETGIAVTHRIEEGDPAAQILSVAKETKCDLIVMGNHTRPSLMQWFTGTMTDQLVAMPPARC